MTIIEQIKAEIERLKATNTSEYNYQNAEGYVWALDDILSFLDTLETEKPVQSDLEEAAEEYEKKHTYQRYDGGELTLEYNATLAEAFIAGHNLCKEQMMKKTERIPKPELTWEDIAEIDTLILKANNEFAVDYSKEISREQFYAEVLNRFNKSKEGKK